MTRQQKALCMCGSHEVAEAIVKLAPSLTDDILRDTLRDEWTRCEAHKPYRADFVELFRRVGFATDSSDPPRRVLTGLTTIYRGNLGEDEPTGIAWTLDRKVAEFFASMSMGLRGRFLGLYRDDGVPTVWRATVPATKILAYFDGRGEREVVVDPATLIRVERIAEARPA